ncbi:uncharacterized protein LOC132032125 [Lycium ferocissimum]|uniref:uncharacterized protein LOC132032125 n=1 Tax=Lycium ferocissimum TaxID=112874 RepID=UPI0028153E59|nr:uncharacterized protein LOC132032125 [Lycium ferocissimum]
MRYLSFSEDERLKKLVKHETYLLGKVNEQEKRISKIQKINEEKEMELLFNQLMEGRSINELDSREMRGFLKVSAAKMDKLSERKKQFIQQHQPSQPQNYPSNSKLVNENVNPSASSMEYLINNPWFFESMATNQNDFGLGAGSGTDPTPTEGDDINAKDDGHSKDLN